LALQDYGPQAFISGREHAVCLVGASLAFRRRVFDTVGLFTPALGRVKDGIGSTEDHDMQLRLWRAGLQGMYVPSIVVIADVTPDRLSKAYHWRWHTGHGRHCAMMRLREMVPADLGPFRPSSNLIRLFGSPAFVYTELARSALRWGQALVLRKDALFYAHQMRHLGSYIETGATHHWTGDRTPWGVVRELSAFAVAYGRKRLRRRNVSSTPSENRA
jgi:cellulose synthase/poly-beta-1,6-N-acetylglucosamine synthase-like glycosyltransferase